MVNECEVHSTLSQFRQWKIYELLKAQETEIANELAWLDYVEEEFIQNMLTYPDAEAILNKIKKEMRND